MFKIKYLVFLNLFFSAVLNAQPEQPVPAARFSFNSGKDYDEISKKKVKLVGTSFTNDRFGNENSAIYLVGNQFSYINLGSDSRLKSKEASISLWVKVEIEIWSGQGYSVNPIIITKSSEGDDFYEAFSLYYLLEGDHVGATTTQDSLKQIALTSPEKFERFKWHHIVFCYDYDYLALYIDGKLKGKNQKGFESKFLSTDSVLIGVTANEKNSRFLNGAVDDLEFYHKVLTENEVKELYEAPNPNRQKIMIYWTLVGLCFLGAIVVIYSFGRYRLNLSVKKEKQQLELANKLLENELRINRALMNPHFIFNSLNTLHNYILTQNTEIASDYLLRFSKLIRKILESNLSDTISLEMELELIERYLEIESLRFKDYFEYKVIMDPKIVPSTTIIPIMMVQPFIENSVWHGLRDKKGDKIITISFSFHEANYLFCVIEDNGLGRKNNNPNLMEKKSLATGFILQRLELLNKIHHLNCYLKIIDKPNNQGTRVEILLPILK
jgi:hypothetical protein